MKKGWKRVRRAMKRAVALRRLRRVTCLDCGFLAHGRDEVTREGRALLACRGSAGMWSNWEAFNCSRSLWVTYDLTYARPSFQGILDEVESSRRTCEGFHRYIPGLSPSRHLEEALKKSERGFLRWLIERLLPFLK